MRFGVIGTAAIARRAFLPAVEATGHEVVAVASREAERARAFADEFGIERAYGSYGELLSDSDVDAVYLPLPNAFHEEWTVRAAEEGIHVLCEKPLAADAEGARRMRERCEAAGVTLMEAYMYRYHTRTERAVEVVREELEGVRTVRASLSSPRGGDDEELVSLDPDVGGGSLMHCGCYPVTAARLFLGEPERAYATASDSLSCGVDTHFTGVLSYDDGATAVVSSSFEADGGQFYRVEAENGWLEARDAFVPGVVETTLEYAADGRRVEETFAPVDQYRLEVEHFVDCVRSGRTPRTSAEEAVRNMAAIDALYASAENGGAVAIER